MGRAQRPGFVTSRHEHQRPVVRKHLVEEHRDVHRLRFRHSVVLVPRWKVLVPLPYLAGKGSLRVDLELVNVDRLAEQLLQWLDQTRGAGQNSARPAVAGAGKRSTRYAALFAPDLLALFVEHLACSVTQRSDFVARKAFREEDVAELVEVSELSWGQLHGGLLQPGWH